MIRYAAALALVVAACGPSETADSTITPTTDSVSNPGTTSQVVAAPSVTATTQETTAPSETTTTEATTTTTGAGNWASQPLVVSEFGALGWWDGSQWIEVDELTSLPVSGGEDYQIAVLGMTATTTGGPETIVCEPPEQCWRRAGASGAPRRVARPIRSGNLGAVGS